MVYQFSTFTLDLASRRLLHGGSLVGVPRRVFDCLAYLMEHRDRAVSRDELIRQVWGRDNVSDNQLAQTILTARRLINDDGATQALIRTVPGFGYHWVGSVEMIAHPTDAALPIAANELPEPSGEIVPQFQSDLPSKPSIKGTRLPSSLMSVTSLLLMLLGGLVAGSWWAYRDSPVVAPAASATASIQGRVWVLPVSVQDLDREPWARLGLMALIAERLRSQGLVVLPVENVLSLIGVRGSEDGSLDIGLLQSEFAAVLVVETDVHKSGNVWLVKLHANPSSGSPLEVHAEGQDLVAATAAATNALLIRLGRPAAQVIEAERSSLESVRQLLRAQDFLAARERLTELTVVDRDSPEARLLGIELDLATGRFAIAGKAVEHLLTDASLANDPVLHARVLLARSQYLRTSGDIRWGDDAAAAVELLEAGAAPLELARSLNSRGSFRALNGKIDDAALDFAQARKLYLGAGDDVGATDASCHLARVSMMRGRSAEALEQLNASVAVYLKYGSTTGAFAALSTMVNIKLGMMRWTGALADSDRAGSMLDKVVDPSKRQLYMHMRAMTLLGNGRMSEAAVVLDEADAERTNVDTSVATSTNQGIYRTQLELMRGQYTTASKFAEVAFAAQLERSPKARGSDIIRLDARDLSLLLLVQSRILEARRNRIAPRPLSRVQNEILEQSPSVLAGIAYGLWLTESGHFTKAETVLHHALVGADKFNRLSRVLAAHDALIQLLLRQQRVDEAQALLTQLMVRDPQVLEQDFDAAVIALRVAQAGADERTWKNALTHALALAGERSIPEELSSLR